MKNLPFISNVIMTSVLMTNVTIYDMLSSIK